MRQFLIILLFCSICSAQVERSNDSIIKAKIKDLHAKRVSPIFALELYCVGCYYEDENNCNLIQSDIYIFWRDGSKNFFQVVDNCNSPIYEINEDIIDYYISREKTILTDIVEEYRISADTVLDVDHSGFSRFTFFIKNDFVVNEINDFYISNEDRNPNINFKRNNALSIVQLEKKIKSAINKS